MRIAAQVLDSTYGKCAVGVRAELARAGDDGWATVALAETDGEGYIADWDACQLERGLYRIVFDSDSYFAGLGSSTAYPEVIVVFKILNESLTFQVQVTLSPYSYSTYFGSIDSMSGASE